MTQVGVHILLNEQDHFPAPGHPENVTRLHPAATWLVSGIKAGRLAPIDVTSHDLSTITHVHSEQYISELEQACKTGGRYLDPDTYVAPGSFRAAAAMVDAVLSAVDTVKTTATRRAFVFGRPPGHHAEFDHPMGFCLINNVAVAAQYTIEKYRAKRVAIVDFDVHHGNGTQHLFYDRNDVYFISTHQFPFYPGTGSAAETGIGSGQGFTLNVPLFAGSGDAEIISVFELQIVPALHRYRPDLLLVSAGFDAHRLDPLGGLKFTGSAFRQLAGFLSTVADQHCNGSMVSVLEGGYSPDGNLDSITNYIDGLVE